MIAFWDDQESAATFAAGHPLGQRFAASGGFHAVLRPLRAFGTWPGLPDDLPHARDARHDGPVLVTTLARLRRTQVIRFFRASRPAERSAISCGGVRVGHGGDANHPVPLRHRLTVEQRGSGGGLRVRRP